MINIYCNITVFSLKIQNYFHITSDLHYLCSNQETIYHTLLNIPPMVKKVFTLCISILSACGYISAQDWSKEDSLWLMNVLEGKEPLKINEDTRKAIEEGRLVAPSWLKSEDGQSGIDMIKDFEQNVPDSVKMQKIDPYSMPPAVFALYVLYIDKMDSIYESRTCMLSEADRKTLEEAMPPHVRHKYYYNELGGGIGGNDFMHVLCMAFSSTYRNKARNRKNANAYKGYYDANAMTIGGSIKMTEGERRQMQQALRNINMKPSNTTVRTSEMRRNGIDD